MRLYTAGFTLLELITATAFGCLLLGVGLASLQRTMSTNRVAAASNQLTAAMLLARSEATKHGSAVILQSHSGGWAGGWIVFPDLDGDGSMDPESEPLLLEEEPSDLGVIIAANRPVSRYIRYIPSGATVMKNGAFQAGTITLCHPDGQTVTRLVITATGRVRTEKNVPGNC